jgi:hypothetical protein
VEKEVAQPKKKRTARIALTVETISLAVPQLTANATKAAAARMVGTATSPGSGSGFRVCSRAFRQKENGLEGRTDTSRPNLADALGV